MATGRLPVIKDCMFLTPLMEKDLVRYCWRMSEWWQRQGGHVVQPEHEQALFIIHLFFFVMQSFVSCVCHECEHGRAHLWGL